MAIAEFDRWLAGTVPVDCEVVVESDDGALRIGVEAGVPFEKAAPPSPKKKK